MRRNALTLPQHVLLYNPYSLMCHKNLQSGLKMLHIISGCEHPVVASFAVALFMLDYLENRIELDSIKS